MDSGESIVLPGHSTIVISLPKAGTYLLAELLRHLGCRSTGLHLGSKGYTDYSGVDLLEARRNPWKFTRDAPLRESLRRIPPGEFAVGHLPFREDVLQATAGFKRLYLTRDLRTTLISYMRFLHSTGRMHAEKRVWYPIADLRKRLAVFMATTAPLILQQLYVDMIGWAQLDGILHVRFEDLTADAREAIRAVEAVATFLGVRNYDAPGILQSSLAAQTITKSDGLTRLDDYWSDEAEKCFVQIGAAELEARLGCCIRNADVSDDWGAREESRLKAVAAAGNRLRRARLRPISN